MKAFMNKLFPMAVGLMLLLNACDDVVNVDTGSADPVLNIDAWVDNRPKVQTIYLTFTQDYFDNVNLPTPARGATVTITNRDGRVFNFTEDLTATTGAYQWAPQAMETIGQVNDTFTLTVVYDGETFVATSKMGRVPSIDDITFEKSDRDNPRNSDVFYQAEFWASEPPGRGDTYWIKTYKNGTLLNKASEINLAYDAALTSGSDVDGVTFISPVRKGINANDEDEDGFPISPLTVYDSIYVEIHSITAGSFNYLNEVVTQTDRNGGLSELFTSTPLANVSTNIVNLAGNGSPVVGIFNVAAVTGYGEDFNLK